jgi:REP element-mobilizing transposase RayT
MSWVRVWIHLVFSTKDHIPFLTENVRPVLFNHMEENSKGKDIKVGCINGYKDHAHCLLALNRDMTIAKAAQLLKGESAHWLNAQNLISQKFAWQDDYWAVGVSESHYLAVFNYIQNQEEHHQKVSFKEELQSFLAKYPKE